MPNHTGTGHHIQSFRDVALTICHSRRAVYCTLVLGLGQPSALTSGPASRNVNARSPRRRARGS
jgi:hypothetical protein